MTFEEWWEEWETTDCEPYKRRPVYLMGSFEAARAAWQAATERAAGIAKDRCFLNTGTPCNQCEPCFVAQKIRGQDD